MGMMNKMRENTGVVLWILVISFGVLWVIQDTGVTDTIGAQTGEIIVVDGDAVSYDEYRRALEQQLEAYRQQTGEPVTPQRSEAEEDRVFDQLVENKLREHEMDRLGITVTPAELTELVLGDDPHPVIKLYFGDGQGGVDRALLQNFLDNPDAEAEWVQLEDYLIALRRQEKLDKLIAGTVRVSEREVEQEYLRRNRTAQAEFVALPYASVPDDSVALTDQDLRRFYDANREDFRRQRTYSVSIATASKLPSAEDTAAVFADLEKMRADFAATDDDSLFLARYGSEVPYTSAAFTRGDLNPELADAVFADPQPGKIVGPILTGNQVHLIKIAGVEPAEETTVKARHILFRAAEGDAEAQAEARRKANDAKRRIQQGEDFATLAQQLSEDPGSGRQGGDLGWFGPGRMVEPFQEAAFNAPIGQVVGPVETQFGYHLIEVQDRARQQVRLADFALALRATPRTLDAAQETLGDIQYFAEEETGDFEAEAERRNVETRALQIEAEQRAIPGIGQSRSIMRFLERADEGDVSDVIELDDQFVVVYVEDIVPEGYRPLDEVENVVRARALREKKQAYQRARLERALEAHGFDGLAQALGLSRRTASVTFANTSVPGLGREPIFVGTVFGLDAGETSGVVEGQTAAFVARTTAFDEPAPMTDEQRTQLRTQLLQQRQQIIQNRWLASLRENAEVVDLRNRYFQ